MGSVIRRQIPRALTQLKTFKQNASSVERAQTPALYCESLEIPESSSDDESVDLSELKPTNKSKSDPLEAKNKEGSESPKSNETPEECYSPSVKSSFTLSPNQLLGGSGESISDMIEVDQITKQLGKTLKSLKEI